MSRRRVHTALQGPPTPVRRGTAAASLHASVLTLHREAGNRAVTRLVQSVQRAVGWSDASKKGHAWNADERKVGKVRRIPLEGLAEGLSMNRKDELARRKWVWDEPEGTPRRKGHWEYEGTRIKALSSEGAKG